MIGALTYQDYLTLIKKKVVSGSNILLSQVQPSSLDLSLSDECYQIEHSFLPNKHKVRQKLKNIIIKKIDLSKKYIFKKNTTYLVRLNEKLNLKNNIFGKCNPKSSTGRLDIFCRTIVDYSDEYEKIPYNYIGEIFLEITPRSFNIVLRSGDLLNQLRLVSQKSKIINDKILFKINQKRKIISGLNLPKSIYDNGIKLSVHLSSKMNTVAYVAKKTNIPIDFSKVSYHNVSDFWQPVKSKNNSLIINNNNFYILRSKEKISIPNNIAGEMVPYDTGIGDFRVHYAGFFDPGFGQHRGSYAVLELKTHEIPFMIEDGQTIARIKYEKLNKNSNVVYGKGIKSNYQNQGLKLSKHFK